MNMSHRSTLIPRLMIVACLTLVLASFATQGVNEPTVVKVMKLETKLDNAVIRVTGNEIQIQQILASKYKLEPAETK